MTRLAAALVAATLLLPSAARAEDTAVTHGPVSPSHLVCEADNLKEAEEFASYPACKGNIIICKQGGTPANCEPWAPPALDHSWHLLTISNGGTVSLIKGLTKRECDEAVKRIPIGCKMPPGVGGCTLLPGDIKSAECFQ